MKVLLLWRESGSPGLKVRAADGQHDQGIVHGVE